jgi:hypothetical protein
MAHSCHASPDAPGLMLTELLKVAGASTVPARKLLVNVQSLVLWIVQKRHDGSAV